MGKNTSFQIPGYKFHLSFLPSPNTPAVNRNLARLGVEQPGRDSLALWSLLFNEAGEAERRGKRG